MSIPLSGTAAKTAARRSSAGRRQFFELAQAGIEVGKRRKPAALLDDAMSGQVVQKPKDTPLPVNHKAYRARL